MTHEIDLSDEAKAILGSQFGPSERERLEKRLRREASLIRASACVTADHGIARWIGETSEAGSLCANVASAIAVDLNLHLAHTQWRAARVDPSDKRSPAPPEDGFACPSLECACCEALMAVIDENARAARLALRWNIERAIHLAEADFLPSRKANEFGHRFGRVLHREVSLIVAAHSLETGRPPRSEPEVLDVAVRALPALDIEEEAIVGSLDVLPNSNKFALLGRYPQLRTVASAGPVGFRIGAKNLKNGIETQIARLRRGRRVAISESGVSVRTRSPTKP